jgi:uncharacterized membrane protein
MTAHLEAGAPPISFHDEGSEYRAGACNIGPAEIARRRRSGHVALVATVALFALLVVLNVPPLVRFIVALPAAVAAACYMEAFLKFCIGFGWLGVFNFGSRGSTQRVADDAARSADRRRSFWLSVVLAAIGVAVGVVAVVLPV